MAIVEFCAILLLLEQRGFLFNNLPYNMSCLHVLEKEKHSNSLWSYQISQGNLNSGLKDVQ